VRKRRGGEQRDGERERTGDAGGVHGDIIQAVLR
jgi:hypothetical protein